jgi:PEP-CTERM motif
MGNARANASAYGGWALVPGTAAIAQSEAKNSKGEVLTTASAPRDAGGGSPSAVTSAGVGAGSIILSPSESQVVSDAILTLTPIRHTNLETIGEGAMSAGFSGGLLQQTYAGTAVFDFKTSATSEALDLNMLSDNAVGIGFNSLTLQVINLVANTTLLSETFSSLTEAAPFFKYGNSVTLGTVTGESQSIEIDFSLSYWNSTGITAGDSFGFAYALVDPPALNAPEPSTWTMMLVGFAGAGFAGYRASRKNRRLGSVTRVSLEI